MAFELPELPYRTTRSSPTSTSRRCASTTTSTTRPTSTTRTARSPGRSGTNHSVEQVLELLDELPADIQKPVRNNAGGHANHTLFWEIMGPDGGGEPTGELASAIDDAFDSLDNLKAAVNDAGVNRFGSGWTWLVLGRHRARGQVDARTRTWSISPTSARRTTCRSSASTSGSTRTTSSTRTAAPTTSRRGGTSSTGTPSPANFAKAKGR